MDGWMDGSSVESDAGNKLMGVDDGRIVGLVYMLSVWAFKVLYISMGQIYILSAQHILHIYTYSWAKYT